MDGNVVAWPLIHSKKHIWYLLSEYAQMSKVISVQSVTKRTDRCKSCLVNPVYGSEEMYIRYVYKRSDDITDKSEVLIPDDAIGVRIVSGYFSDGEPTEERFAEWLEPVRD